MIAADPGYRPDPSRAIYVSGLIDEQLVYRLTPSITSLQSANRLPITVYIDSPGGSVAAAQSLLRLLTASNQDFAPPCRVITVVSSLAASAAADLLSSGDYALAYPHSSVLFHGIRLPRTDPITAEDSKIFSTVLRSINDRFAAELMRKNEFRFVIRFLLARHQFDSIRKNCTETLTEAECFLRLVENNLSSPAKRLFNMARDRQQRYEGLLKTARRAKKGKNAAQSDANRIKAIIEWEVAEHKREKTWTFAREGLSRLNEDFFLLNELLESLEGDRLANSSWVPFGKFVLSKPDQEAVEKAPTEQQQALLASKVRPLLEPLWSFFVALCHALQEGENQFTANDAYWLGLIDEVIGDEKLGGFRQIAEYRPDQPAEETPKQQGN